MKTPRFIILLFLVPCLFTSCRGEEETAKDAERYYSQAIELYKKEEYGKAIELWERVLAISPHHGESYTCIGHSYVYLGKIQDAAPYLMKALRYQPYDINAMKMLCKLSYENKSDAEYLDFCGRCLELDPKFPDGYVFGIIALLKAGERERAENLLAVLETLDSKKATGLKERLLSGDLSYEKRYR